MTCSCIAAQHERLADVVLLFNDKRLHLIDILCDEAKSSISQDHNSVIDFFRLVTSAVASFTTQNIEPPLRVIRTLLFDILLKAPSASSVYETYNYLLFLLQRHPPKDELPFTWGELTQVLDDLQLQRGMHHVDDSLTLLRHKLALSYMTEALEVEYLNRPLRKRREVRQSQCYRWLSTRESSSCIKPIVTWLVAALQYGDFDVDITHALQSLTLNDAASAANDVTATTTPNDVTATTAPTDLSAPPDAYAAVTPALTVYGCVERLLDLSLALSAGEKCVDDYAHELRLEYQHLYYVEKKVTLMQNISNPHLQLALACKVLDTCDGAVVVLTQ